MALWEVDTAIEGYEEPRHTYLVVADDQEKANMKAEKKFRGWLLTHAKAKWSRPAQILR